ncbi:MAG: Sugar phosphate isomerase/epimerase [Lachnoclostridium sp.]|jgi:sugar phosphate isomerase/epimerase
MDKSLLVINTLVFFDQLKKGISQSEMIDTIYQLGVTKAEVRREFIKDFELELEDLKKKASDLNMELFYSVPELLYIEGKLQTESIENYFKEAFAMGCCHVKMNIGDYHVITFDDINKLNQLTDQYRIQLTVENDQTKENGKAFKIKEFMETNHQLGGKVSVTFDIGNWIWQREDPAENARQLKRYVTYIHLKDVSGKENPKVVLLNEGDIDWKSILDILPQNVPIALEYPCGEDVLNVLAGELDKLFEYSNY